MFADGGDVEFFSLRVEEGDCRTVDSWTEGVLAAIFFFFNYLDN